MKHDAIVLLGPTGAGKTPLGEALVREGLYGRRCVHFDFGAQLRLAARIGAPGLTPDDVATVQNVLTEGALLEDEHFYIAELILEDFMDEEGVGVQDLVILNGLPRHVGQARNVKTVLNIVMVLALECTADVVHARIAQNSGGDRTGRTDDAVEEIARKLELYAARTQPLLDLYRAQGVQTQLVPVGVNSTPSDILDVLNSEGLDTES